MVWNKTITSFFFQDLHTITYKKAMDLFCGNDVHKMKLVLCRQINLLFIAVISIIYSFLSIGIIDNPHYINEIKQRLNKYIV